MTSFKSIKADVANAGAHWEDSGSSSTRALSRPKATCETKRGLTSMKGAKIASGAGYETRVVILNSGEEAFAALTNLRTTPS